MKAIEFSAKIVDNQIQIPIKFEHEVKSGKDKEVRVIIMMDEAENNDINSFEILAREQFLNGYASSDAIYDR